MNKNIIKSLGYALLGLKVAWREEPSFKIELVVTAFVLGLSYFFCISQTELILVIFAMCSVLVTEMLNTALEELCDKFEPTPDPHIGKIKDLAAAAVLIAVIGAIVIGIIIFTPYIKSIWIQ